MSSKKIVPESNPSIPGIANSNLVERSQAITSLIRASDAKALHRMIIHYGYDTDLGTCGIGGTTPLHEAAKHGDRNIMVLLLSFKTIDVNIVEGKITGGYSALHYACKENHQHIVRLLIENGANPNIKSLSSFSETPLHICCKNGFLDCARILLVQGGADVNATDAFGNNPSFWAYSKNHERLIKELSLPPPASPSAMDFYTSVICKNSNITDLFSSTKKKKKKPAGDKKKKKKKP